MRRIPARRALWTSVGLLGAAVPATVLTVALWPSPESREPEAVSDRPAATQSVLDEIRDLRLRTLTPASTAGGTTAPPATRPGEDVTVVVTQQPVRPTAEVDAVDSRAEMVERRAMESHPRPPESPVIAPGIQSSIDASDEDPIDLGTLVPPDEPAYSPSQQRP
ncbi:hypothetical protein FHU38_002327 [Saccharomonospora amisosensis]|uniref:Uncharacterized protein n=1 Tax=Saccharomonospora amisosensis TaxID=1128677 RepID=A0A7X5UQM8_9PSEU|nr:hypothetical protein [Saccharomonospora amisosensis]NIJ11983.1 hypothetical protein [Saccharomonospora amisosensis]